MIRPAPESLFDLKFLRDAHLSPDGHRVAYAVSRIEDEQERIEIWISDLAGSAPLRLPYAGNATAPRWSPDGRWIAFCGDGCVHVAAYPGMTLSGPLTPHGFSTHGAATWSPDSARLAVSLTQHRAHALPRRISRRHYRADGLGFIDDFSQRIYEIDRLRGSARALTLPAQWLCSQPEWSTCGRYILFLVTDEPVHLAGYSYRLLLLDVELGEVKELLGAPWSIACAKWLPDSTRIALVAACRSELMLPHLSLWVMEPGGAAPQRRSPPEMGTIGCSAHHDMPAWDLTANMLAVADRHVAFVSVQSGGDVEIWRVTLEGEVSGERALGGEQSRIVLDAQGPKDILLFGMMDAHTPLELWCASLDSSREQRITHLNDDVLAQWPTLEVSPFAVTSADGMKLDAWVMAPAARMKPLPTVLFIHGGPFGTVGSAFRYDCLLLAAHGFAVVYANFRGSVGYGAAFTGALLGNWGERGFADHMATVDAAIALGIADPERLGVWGPSHGGFATCWVVGHTNRFKAAVAEAAFTSFSTLYYLTDVPELFAHELGGRPHEIPDVYRARSPITYAHRCSTPTLLIHGEEDLRCPISEAEQFYRVLHDVGCVAELLRLPGSSHLGDSVGPVAARRAQNEALLSWFQRYL